MRTFALAVSLAALSFAAGQTPEPPDPKKGKDEARPKPFADKLVHAPTPVPDRVILTWSGDPTTTQSVTWRTDTTVTAAEGQITEAVEGPSFDVQWSKSKTAADVVRTVPAVTTPLATDLNPCHYHSVTFRGLKPKTKYVYRVGAGADWSEWFQFETVSDKAEPFGFIYVGDAQNGLKRHWSRLMRQAVADMPKARFILHAGDLVDRGRADADWGEWFQAQGWITGSYQHLMTPGNHEYGGPPAPKADPKNPVPPAPPTPRKPQVVPHWKPQFTLPENGPAGLEETCYYLDIQGVRLISLNSMEQVEVQVPWLENAIKTNPHRWTVVTYHVPMYSLTKARQESEEKKDKDIRKFWRPILERLGVDLVLQGHDHAYGRSGLMRDDNPLAAEKDAKGIVYVVSVSGAKMYDLNVKPWMISSAEKKQFYQLIRVDGDRLHFEARTADGALYDEFELRKKADGRSELLEKAAIDAEKNTPAGGPLGREVLFAVGGVVLLAGGYAGVRALRRSA